MTRARDLADFNLDGKAVTINESSADLDFRVEGNGNANLLFVDAGNDRVGIGTSSPATALTIASEGKLRLYRSDNSRYGDIFNDNSSLNIETSNDPIKISGQTYVKFDVDGSEVMRISSSRLGLGTTSPTKKISASIGLNDTDGFALEYSGDAKAGLFLHPSAGEVRMGAINSNGTYFTTLYSNNSERLRILSSGDVLVGTDNANPAENNVAGIGLLAGNSISVTDDGGAPIQLNRKTDDGSIAVFRKDGSNKGSIGIKSNRPFFSNSDNSGIRIAGNALHPSDQNGSGSDNSESLGESSVRWTQLFAGTSTIGTSDENEKQNITSLSDAEIVAAKAISKLFKTFKFKDAVSSKGDAARTHTGVTAQQVQTAMTDAGLDATKYAFWCSDTWWETNTTVPAVEAVEAAESVYDDDGNLVSPAVDAVEAKDAYNSREIYHTEDEAPEGATKHTRLGIRYAELLSFIGAATEQRLADIETRLSALEDS